MGQQSAILVIVDVASALKARAMKGNTYLFDNMGSQGSHGLGTGDLVCAVNGTHWCDGSQADSQILNWLTCSLGSIPPTVPRSFHAERSRANDQEALDALSNLGAMANTSDTDVLGKLRDIRTKMGSNTRVRRRPGAQAVDSGQKLLNIRGQVVAEPSADDISEVSYPSPVITDIRGEAVDKGVIFPAQCGSPELLTDGWYWSASVDTSRPGIYRYTMMMYLHELSWTDGALIWEPIPMTYESRIRIDSAPNRNGFTNAGIGMLPISAVRLPSAIGEE